MRGTVNLLIAIGSFIYKYWYKKYFSLILDFKNHEKFNNTLYT